MTDCDRHAAPGAEDIGATLKRLLDAETRAEAIVEEASQRREAMINETLAQAREAEARLEDSLPALRAPIIREAELRAASAIAELQLKFEERQRDLRRQAARNAEDALKAAEALMLDPSR